MSAATSPTCGGGDDQRPRHWIGGCGGVFYFLSLLFPISFSSQICMVLMPMAIVAEVSNPLSHSPVGIFLLPLSRFFYRFSKSGLLLLFSFNAEFELKVDL